jgi:deazaflavin-dependent oxidoreductase (nitroreductase family)
MGLLADEAYLYLTTTGRVTGLPRQIEIWFVAEGGHLYILAEHFQKAQWVQNIVRQPRVKVRVAKLEFEATARVLDRERDGERWNVVQDLSRQKYKWGEGLPVEITPDDPLVLAP